MNYTRILVIGVPRAGKSTLVDMLKAQLDIPVTHIDEWAKDMPWSFVSDRVAEKLESEGPWIMEGVAGVRGLRKWLLKNEGKPEFHIVWMNDPKVKLTAGQDNMRNGTKTIWAGVKQTLEVRGVNIFDETQIRALVKAISA